MSDPCDDDCTADNDAAWDMTTDGHRHGATGSAHPTFDVRRNAVTGSADGEIDAGATQRRGIVGASFTAGGPMSVCQAGPVDWDVS